MRRILGAGAGLLLFGLPLGCRSGSAPLSPGLLAATPRLVGLHHLHGRHDGDDDDSDDDGGPPTATPTETSATPTPVDPCATPADWQSWIASGNPTELSFDLTAGKFTDGGPCGLCQTDPMGTLVGGQNYSVVYDAESQSFTVNGFNQWTQAVGTWTYVQPNFIDDDRVSIWGRDYAFTPRSGLVWDDEYGLVGHLRKPGC